MILAAFCPGVWRLENALQSEDTEVLGKALEELGASVRFGAEHVVVQGQAARPVRGEVFLGENATGLRLLLAVVPALGGTLGIDGAPGLRARPLEPSLALLGRLNAQVSGKRLPVRADGSEVRWDPDLHVDASMTTQVASGALLACALGAGRGLVVEHPSAPAYLRVTAQVCRQFGWQVDETPRGGALQFTVSGSPRAGGDVVIPGDPSARVFPLALAALHRMDGAKILPVVPGDPHPDWAVDGDLQKLRAAGGEVLELGDLAARPDCLPALAVVAAARSGVTRFTGLPALRAKESDRLSAMAAGLLATGLRCEELPEGLVVEGPLPVLGDGPRSLPTAPDHRVVMALSLLGTLVPAGVLVENTSAVAKSWPGFFDWLGRVAVVERAP
jgi:3-phosphoshikimate 1-carboxyvinyltransferase